MSFILALFLTATVTRYDLSRVYWDCPIGLNPLSYRMVWMYSHNGEDGRWVRTIVSLPRGAKP